MIMGWFSGTPKKSSGTPKKSSGGRGQVCLQHGRLTDACPETCRRRIREANAPRQTGGQDEEESSPDPNSWW
jgi:hypothetical protein